MHELRWTESLLRALSVPEHLPGLTDWIERVRDGLEATDERYPFVLYGTDWLAFAHLVIAVAFYGPYRDPVRNIWVVEFGMIACAGIIPLALICGPIRGIPFWWTVIDMSFGVVRRDPALRRTEADQAAGGADGGAIRRGARHGVKPPDPEGLRPGTPRRRSSASGESTSTSTAASPSP